MKQLTQRLRDGRIELLDVPVPELDPAGVLIDVRASLVSTGTERSRLDAARKSLLGKARARPDQARQVLTKARRDGIQEALQAVRLRLDAPTAVGYSAAGVVLAVGERVRDVRPGDRVACGGAGAVHAEIDLVPSNLCVPIPGGVPFTDAAFATVGAIALHGVRQSDARVGEKVAVIGLGLVGQLTCRILQAAGCRVIGVDLSPRLVDRTQAAGVVEAAFVRSAVSDSLPPELEGVDAVMLTAATQSNDPVELAAQLCRDRGRVVVVGDVGLSFSRAAYYDKEIEIRMSRSYGPGRYDREYEERGLDYPIGYVRWTERRNMAAFLELVEARRLDVAGLVAERVLIDDAAEAYERLLTSSESPLGLVIEYGPSGREEPRRPRPREEVASAPPATTGVVGAGSFAQRILIPGLKHAGFDLVGIASASGLSARGAAERFGFRRASTASEIIDASDIGLAVVATRHASHAELAERALRADKAVFVEKPPCLTEKELVRLRIARDESRHHLVVGFNRPHAPLAQRLSDHIRGARKPIELLYRVNAPALPAEHWQNDLDDGGGRLLGEGCHFIDFACWLIPNAAEWVMCSTTKDEGPIAAAQSFTVVVGFSGGSSATIVYTSQGALQLPKEYIEAHSGGRSALLHDFRLLEMHGDGRRRRERATQEKGHFAQFEHLYALVQGGAMPLPHDQLRSMEVTLAALRSARTGRLATLGNSPEVERTTGTTD